MTTAAELLAAVQAGDLARVRRVLASEPELATARDPAGVSLLLHARYRQRFDIVESFVERRAGALDLFEAAALGRRRDVEELLTRDRRSVSSFAGDGFTALHLAAFFSEPDCVRVLLARGADPEAVAQNPTAVRPIHSAAAGGSLEVIEQLLSRGVDVDSRQRGGWTALHAAALSGRADLARTLLQHGARTDLTSDEGARPVDLARRGHHAAVIQLLEPAAGA